MTGSSYIPIVVPIMAFLAMFGWLGLVFYADRHPGWKPRKTSVSATTTGADGSSEASSQDRAVDAPPAGVPGLAPAASPTDTDHGLTAGEAPVGAGHGLTAGEAPVGAGHGLTAGEVPVGAGRGV